MHVRLHSLSQACNISRVEVIAGADLRDAQPYVPQLLHSSAPSSPAQQSPQLACIASY